MTSTQAKIQLKLKATPILTPSKHGLFVVLMSLIEVLFRKGNIVSLDNLPSAFVSCTEILCFHLMRLPLPSSTGEKV